MFRRCVEKTLGSTVDRKNLAKQSTPPVSASKILNIARSNESSEALSRVGGRYIIVILIARWFKVTFSILLSPKC